MNTLENIAIIPSAAGNMGVYLILSNVSQWGRCANNIIKLRLLNATSGKGRDIIAKPVYVNNS